MPPRERISRDHAPTPQPFTSEQTDIYLQGQRLTAFVSDYIVESTPKRARLQYGVEVQPNTTRGGPKETRTLRPNQYMTLVRYLIDRGGLEVPRHIIRALRSLIRIRKVVCSWFRDTEDAQTIGDNVRHQHFVEVLERVDKMLSPYEVATAASLPKLKADEGEVEAITNIFAHLEIFETAEDNDGLDTSSQTDEELQAKAESAVDVFSGENKTQARKDYKRICETNWMLHQCYLIRAHIQQKWRDHHEGRCDLSVVTVLTNAAVEIVERMEDAFLLKYMRDLPRHLVTEAYIELLEDDDSDGQSFGAARSSMPLFDLRSAWALCESLVKRKHERIQEYYLGPEYQLGMKDLLRRHESGEWDGDVKKGMAAMEAFHDSLRWDALLDNYPHQIEPHLSIQAVVDPEKYHYSPELLKELEEVFEDNLRECTREHPCHSSVEDYILKALRKAVIVSTASLSSAFALALFVDIREMTDVSSLYLIKVDDAAERLIEASVAIDMHTVKVVGPDGPFYTDSTGRRWRCGDKDICWYARRVRMGHNGDSAPDCFTNSEGFKFCVHKNIRNFLKQSPLTSGSLELFFRLARQYISMAIVDGRETIKACMHFYNAAHQQGHIDTPWPDMERLIELHGWEALFLGPCRPATLEECIDRWRRAFGFAVDLKPIYATRGKIDRNKMQGFFQSNFCPLLNLLGVTTATNNIIGWRLTPFEDIEMVLGIWQRNPKQLITLSREMDLEKKPLQGKVPARQPSLEPLQLLNILEERSIVEEAAIDAFDYLHMDRLCWEMLSRVRDVYVEQKMYRYFDNSRELLDGKGRGSRELVLLSYPLFWFAHNHDGSRKELSQAVDKLAAFSVSRSSGPRREGEIPPLGHILREYADITRKPYDTSARLMRGYIRQHGNDVTKSGGQNTREARHWVAVGTGAMLHTSPRVLRAPQRDELGTARKCVMLLP